MDRQSLRPAVYPFVFVFVLSSQSGSAQTRAPTSQVSYAGQRVVRLVARTQEDVDAIGELNVDVWNCFGPGVGTSEARVTPEQLKALGDLGIPFEILVPDLQTLVDTEREMIARAAESSNGDWFQNFKRGAEIDDYLGALAQQFPALAEVALVGQSIEGRDIRMIRITGPEADGNPRDARPAFVIDGTQHAREWIAPMTVIFALDTLLRQYDTSPRVRAVVDAVDFYFVPNANPDGYEYTWTTDRYWRKNRRITGSRCDGIDLNRNWSVGWGGNGSSNDPCSEVYHGPEPWSEPEVVAVRGLTESLTTRIGGVGAYLDFHSFGQLVLSPWMYTLTPPPNAEFLNGNGQLISDAIFAVHGVRYRSGQGSQILYIAAGTAHDWAYGELGTAAWGIELRGNNFVLPPDQIVPTGEENLEGILELCEALFLPGNFKAN